MPGARVCSRLHVRVRVRAHACVSERGHVYQWRVATGPPGMSRTCRSSRAPALTARCALRALLPQASCARRARVAASTSPRARCRSSSQTCAPATSARSRSASTAAPRSAQQLPCSGSQSCARTRAVAPPRTSRAAAAYPRAWRVSLGPCCAPKACARLLQRTRSPQARAACGAAPRACDRIALLPLLGPASLSGIKGASAASAQELGDRGWRHTAGQGA